MDRHKYTLAVLILYVCIASSGTSADASSNDEFVLNRVLRRVNNPCSAPTVPRSISYNTPVNQDESGRKRWQYTITWQRPVTINCASITNYQIRFPDASAAQEVVSGSTLQKVYYTDGETSVNFIITAKNDGGFTSQAASLAITTPALPPQVRPMSLEINATSTSNEYCVKLTWLPPDYPNGVISKYQVNCASSGWKDIPTNLVYQECGFSAYEEVSCLLNAHNSAGSSSAATSDSIHMFCGAPTVPRSISYNTPVRQDESGRKRWKYTITWQHPANIGCASISNYQIRFPDASAAQEEVPGSTLQKVYYTDGDTPVNFILTAKNDGGFTSQSASVAITTPALPPQVRPMSLEINATSTSNEYCVKLTWLPPEYPNGVISKYRVNCASSGWKDIPTNLIYQQCGFSAYEEVSCLLNAHNSAGPSSTATSDSIHMFCGAPTVPRSISYNTPVRQNESGRKRWQYTITWQHPANIGCASISNYQIRFPNESAAEEVVSGSTLQKVYFTDGDIPVNVSITAKNDGGFTSQSASLAITTPALPPQVRPMSLEINATSTSNKYCVKLTWLPPEYPNGVISKYQVNCAASGWKNIPTNLIYQKCGLSAYQEVSCRLKAHNSAGPSSTATSDSIHMFCGAPSAPSTLTFGNPSPIFHDGRDRWSYTVTWQPPNANCESITGYTTRYPSYAEGLLEGTAISREIIVDGDEQVAFYVSSENNEQLTSAVFSQTIRTPSLRPQTTPTNVVLLSDDAACVTLSWQPPAYPNGDITDYQVKCSNAGAWTDISSNVTSYTQCGYSPYETVQCMVRAVNSAGESDIATSAEVKTQCSAPSAPSTVSFGDPTQEMNDGRERWKYTVTWQAATNTNCESLSAYISSHSTDDGESLASLDLSRVLYADGNVDIAFYVSAQNNANLSSTTASASITTPMLRPQVAPRSVTLVAVGPFCVNIAWELPEYLNGPIIGFRFSIQGFNVWTEVNWDISQLANHTVCGFQPYQEVQLRLQVTNYAGSSDPTTSPMIRTDCADPTLPADLHKYVTEEIYLPTGASYHRRRITVDVTPQDIVPNCLSISSLEFWLEGSRDRISNGQIVDDLDAETNYTIKFEATNNENLNSVGTVVVKTGELEPNAVGLTVMAYNLSCVTISWTDPVPYTGTITNYQYRCALTPSIDQAVYQNYGAQRNILSCNYNPAEKVTCQVKAFTSVGEGPMVGGEATIGCDDPAAPDIRVTDQAYDVHERLEKIKMTVSWQPTPPTCNYIEKYDALVTDGDTELYSNTFGGLDALTFDVSDLQPISNYSISLSATNDQGYSSSATIVWKTSEIKPTDAPGVQLSFDTNCVNISATSPEETNGIIKSYAYNCRSEVTLYGNFPADGPEREGSIRVCGFLPAAKIICSVSAVNTAGESPSKTVVGYTLIELKDANLKKPYTLMESEENSAYVPVQLHPVSLVNVNPERIKYRLIVSLPGDSDSRVKRSILFPRCHSDNLYGYAAADNLGIGCYIAAEVEGSKVVDENYTFYLGDGETYGDFVNTALQPNLQYNMTVGIVVSIDDGKQLLYYFQSSAFSSPPPPVPPVPTEAPPACGVPCIIGICVALLILLLIIIIICIVICCKRRGRRRKEVITGKKPRNIAMDEMKVTGENAPTSNTPLLTTNNEELPKVKRKEPLKLEEPIKLENLSDYVKDKAHIRDQYENVLEQMQMPTIEAARLPENKGKCKYIGIYPGDSNRVKLYKEKGDGTDFINASFIAGYAKDNEFIAAQGPQASATDDFWLMIFQQKPKAVVMVTNLVELGQKKCEQYWPDHIGDSWKFGDISIILTKCDIWADFSVRDMTVTKGEEMINIQQYHFTSWPDHGVPTEMSPFITFVRKLDMETSHHSGPLLVHCSAGVGRTGTLISLMNLLNEARDKPTVDVLNCVAKMRERRPNMVQVQAQYYFLHCVLDEYLRTETFLCSPTDVGTRLEAYAGKKGSPSDVISSEYQRIEDTISKQVVDTSLAVEKHNILKNRSPDIFPDANHAVYLDGGEYINAVAVDDYTNQRNLVCTQLPLSNTVIDFWRMIEIHGVRVIVQLEQQDASFYPDNDEDIVDYAGITITRTQTKQVEHMEMISLSVEFKKKERKICLLVAKDWNEQTPPAYSAMVYYLAALEKQQQQHRSSRICITDMDGSKRCGLFAAAYNAVERLKGEQVVDLYTTVLMARSRRRQFISSIDEMVYLYGFLKYHTETFSDDANFNQQTI